MKRETLAKSLKAIEVFLTFIVAMFYFLLVPQTVIVLGEQFPEFAYLVRPGIAAISVSAIPVVISLVCFWRICTNIGADCSFCMDNAKKLTLIGVCALADAVYCFAFFGFLFAVGAFNPSVLVIALCTTIFGLAVAMAAFLLAHLVEKASAMEEEIKFTV